MDPELYAYVVFLVNKRNEQFLKDANDFKKTYTANMANARAKNIPTKDKKLILFNLTKRYNTSIRSLMLIRRKDVTYIVENTKNVPGKNYRKFALIVGINYTENPNDPRQLKGSVLDAMRIEKKLKAIGYQTVLLVDNSGNVQPTLNNITENLFSLLKNKVNGDSLFFYFSGHATFINDANGDDLDGKDELFTTVDINPGTGQPNYLTDDNLNTLIKNNLQTGVRMVCVMDGCNSGTLLDLKYNYFDTSSLYDEYKMDLSNNILVSNPYYGKIVSNPYSGETNGQIILLSSSQDNQLSGEAQIDYGGGIITYSGIFTFAFLKVFEENQNELTSYSDFLFAIRQKIATIGIPNLDQTAQLSSGKLMNPNTTYFSL